MNKPHTISNDTSAGLVAWLINFPTMRKQPRAWFANNRFTPDELKEAYQFGFQKQALDLGYRPARNELVFPVVITRPTLEQVAA